MYYLILSGTVNVILNLILVIYFKLGVAGATPKSKKTNRLIQTILYTSSQLSSLNASKLLKSENISVCKSSICDLLKKMPSIVDKLSLIHI